MPDESDEPKVYEGPAEDAVVVKLALERDGIPCRVVDNLGARGRLRGAVYLLVSAQAARARLIVGRHLKGSSPSEAALAHDWQCAACGEAIEGQFQACWKCGSVKP